MAFFCNRKWDKVNQAYATLLSSTNYLEGVLVLHRSLEAVHSHYPLLVLVTEEVATPEIKAIFEEEGIFYSIVTELEYSLNTQDKHRGRPVLKTASKIHLFHQVNWDKLVYIDADVIVLHNIDDLFVRLDGSMVKYPNDNLGFSGMFVCQPRFHDERDFYQTLIREEECFDGDLLGKIWFFIQTNSDYWIPSYYLVDPHGYDSDVKAVHFCNSGKPWMKENCNDGTFLGWKYNLFLQEIREKYNTAHYSFD